MENKLNITNKTSKFPSFNESEKEWEWVEKEDDDSWNELLSYINNEPDTIIAENTPGYDTIMDGVPLIQIFFAKKEKAKSKFSFIVQNVIYRHIDSDYLLDEDFIKNLCNLPDFLLKNKSYSLSFSVYTEITRLFNYDTCFDYETINEEIIDAYHDYKLDIIEATQSMISTHKWLEELAELEYEEHFSADDTSFQAKYPVCSYNTFEILNYIKGQQLLNDKI